MAETIAERNAARKSTIVEFGFYQYVVGQIIRADEAVAEVYEVDMLSDEPFLARRERRRTEFPPHPALQEGARYMIVGYADDHMQPSGVEIRDIIVSTELFSEEFPESDALHSAFA